MALPANFISELAKNPNSINVIAEVTFITTRKLGLHLGGFTDVFPNLKKVPVLFNKIDADRGFSLRGDIQLVVTGREFIKDIISQLYLMNRRVTLKVGFVTPGYAYADYADIYKGKITDWRRKGDELTVTVSDDMFDAETKVPAEVIDNTQTLDYTSNGVGQSPDTIINNMLTTQLGIAAGSVNTANITAEAGTWLSNWKLHRVLTEPSEAKNYLAQLQRETMMYLFNSGVEIDGKVFAPPLPGTTVEEWTDDSHILEGLSEESGYKDSFFNRVIVRFDYDESGSSAEENFQTWIIDNDTASQSASEHDEIRTKEINAYWIRSKGWEQPTNITGVVIYHASTGNPIGNGTLTFTYSGVGLHTLQWTPPSGTIGTAVTVSESGRYQIFGGNGPAHWIRVVVTLGSLPGANKSDTIGITALNGVSHATTVARKILNRYRDPSAKVKFRVDINEVVHASEFIKPTDLKDLTTDEAFEKGESTWVQERMMLTSVRPDFDKNVVDVEAVETKMYQRYGFVAPAGQADYPTATASEKERAYIGNASNKVNGGAEDGYVIW